MDHPPLTSHSVTAAQCQSLRHKGMYVLSVPDPGEREHCGTYDATAYWCTRTMKALGPDGQPVHRDACERGAGRACCDAMPT